MDNFTTVRIHNNAKNAAFPQEHLKNWPFAPIPPFFSGDKAWQLPSLDPATLSWETRLGEWSDFQTLPAVSLSVYSVFDCQSLCALEAKEAIP